MKRAPYLTLIFICVLSPLAVVSSAEDMGPEKIMSFANYLFEQADYYRAITEYERLIFFYPKHPLAKTAAFQIAKSYLKGGKYTQAAQRFRALAEMHPDDDIGIKSFLMTAEAYYQKGSFGRAIDVLESFISSYPSDPHIDAARIKIGLAYLRAGEWRKAREELRKVPDKSSLHEQAAALAVEAEQYPDIPRKSPALAGGLSAVLPGAGQFYIGRPRDAAVSFFLNGLFVWATVEAFRRDNDVTGGILLFFESGWYLGNVYNAVSGAHKFNRRAEERLLDDLQSRYDVLISRTEEDEFYLTLSMHF